jgi:mono/diheme cytochrome c family protein
MTRPPSPLAKLVGLALAAGLVALVPSWSSSAAILRVDDDDEEREVRRVEARRSFVENCLMCHGEDMTARQRLTTKQWAAEVEKMVGWGAPLPPDRKQPLIDHLAETYPSTQPAPPVERISPERALALEPQPLPVRPIEGAEPKRGEALFATHCAACHGRVARGGDLGTNLVEKPSLLREDEFRTLLQEGRRRMPGFAAVLDDRSRGDLLAWLRRQK